MYFGRGDRADLELLGLPMEKLPCSFCISLSHMNVGVSYVRNVGGNIPCWLLLIIFHL